MDLLSEIGFLISKSFFLFVLPTGSPRVSASRTRISKLEDTTKNRALDRCLTLTSPDNRGEMSRMVPHNGKFVL
jgi:hypothetical protein